MTLVDRYADPAGQVHSPIVPWAPTDPQALPQTHLAAVQRYLTGDRETPRQQGLTPVDNPCA